MASVKSWSRRVAATAALCLVLAGCATQRNGFHTHPQAVARCQQIKMILVASPEVKAYEVSAGGNSEQVGEWSAQAVDNVSKALVERFKGSGITIATLTPQGAGQQELEEVRALFGAVTQSIHLHTFSNKPNYFPDWENQFDFSVGSLQALLKPQGGDALLLVYGEDQFATTGKKALNTLGAITGVLASAVTGVAMLPHTEGTYLQMALADRDGHILWYNVKSGRSDLRQPDSCNKFVEDALEDFPGFAK
ncbi:MAG TPA: hypothetical protein VJ550_07150 [Geomonas sp.]|nr:hypothetical protein [Geomonas sp.]